MKENDLLKASLATEQSRPGSKVLEETKKALAETTRKLAEQTESAGRLALEKEALQSRGRALTASVGAYQLEKTGIHLFERIEGDHFTILGLPLLRLLEFLRQDGCLAD